jgi:hypothetical protein
MRPPVGVGGGDARGRSRCERVEALVPHPAVALEPGVDVAERSGVDGVEPPRALGANGREAVLAQHPQVLRHRRLGDAELRLHHGSERARRLLAVGEELEDAAAHGVAEDVEGVHERIAYRVQLI